MTPQSPEVISRQATANIGTIGEFLCSCVRSRRNFQYFMKVEDFFWILSAGSFKWCKLHQWHHYDVQFRFQRDLSVQNFCFEFRFVLALILLNVLSSINYPGHVAHGKSTVVKAISSVHTVRFKNELERNITIKLGECWSLFIFMSPPSFPPSYYFKSIISVFGKKKFLSFIIWPHTQNPSSNN